LLREATDHRWFIFPLPCTFAQPPFAFSWFQRACQLGDGIVSSALLHVASAGGSLCSRGNPSLLNLKQNISSPTEQMQNLVCHQQHGSRLLGQHGNGFLEDLGFHGLPSLPPGSMKSTLIAGEAPKQDTEVIDCISMKPNVRGGLRHPERQVS